MELWCPVAFLRPGSAFPKEQKLGFWKSRCQAGILFLQPGEPWAGIQCFSGPQADLPATWENESENCSAALSMECTLACLCECWVVSGFDLSLPTSLQSMHTNCGVGTFSEAKNRENNFPAFTFLSQFKFFFLNLQRKLTTSA
jgi:hypothetical protein